MKIRKLIAVAAAAFCLTTAGAASASPADMQEFRSTYMPEMKADRDFHIELLFNGPTFHANAITSWSMSRSGASVMQGDFSWAYTDKKHGETKQFDIPIYGERNGDALTVYANRGGSWKRENLLNDISWFVDAMLTNSGDTKQKIADAVKDVKATDVGKDNRRMELILDGKALANLQSNLGNKGATPYISRALAESDPRVIWTVNKRTGETVTVAMDMTNFMQNYAKAVLDDSYKSKITLTPEETQFLASVGYYYTLQFYLSGVQNHRQIVSVPAEVKNNAQDHLLLNEIENEIVSVVQ